ncbi:hypothetical protein CXB51_014813 [Gossypium anomalum]|uniref:Uncharacterized protein n=1 Tax=Gossypium anomalum TaxID=47600 RepID=A0A8J5Z0I6_9ROSI|nr:hypothetical protein CXB51_014813 [Gossypium anomalum]
MFKLAFDNEWHDPVKEVMDRENPIMLAFRSQAEEIGFKKLQVLHLPTPLTCSSDAKQNLLYPVLIDCFNLLNSIIFYSESSILQFPKSTICHLSEASCIGNTATAVKLLVETPLNVVSCILTWTY